MAKAKTEPSTHPVKYRMEMLKLQLADLEARKDGFPADRQDEVSQKIKALKYKIANCDAIMKKYPV